MYTGEEKKTPTEKAIGKRANGDGKQENKEANARRERINRP